MDEIRFVIPLPPITKKNHLQIFRTKQGRPFVAQSKQYKEYEAKALLFLRHKEPITYPVNVECRFFMKSKRRVDLVNLQEAVLDILVKGGVLGDDNRDIVACMDNSRVDYDKENPRTEIIITPKENYEQWKQGE